MEALCVSGEGWVMRLPAIDGLIRRRILVNFRVDPDVIQPQLPVPFRPKLLGDAAMVGICLIRLEQIRPSFIPASVGWSGENAAHRIAVRWEDEHGKAREGVYIPRRDSASRLIQLTGGRLFPGEHHAARFAVRDDGDRIELSMQSADGLASVHLRARRAEALPSSSRFDSLAAASEFFAAGSLGYSERRRRNRLDGLRLQAHRWRVEPLVVDAVASSYFADEARFPPGSIAFDCALIMRDIPHTWRAEPPLVVSCPALEVTIDSAA
jgi:hypothetical protein